VILFSDRIRHWRKRIIHPVSMASIRNAGKLKNMAFNLRKNKGLSIPMEYSNGSLQIFLTEPPEVKA
jgi:hypothetical protein